MARDERPTAHGADVIHVVALSGGKDSTAMALRLADVEPHAYTYLCTPTGAELPDMLDHWRHLEALLGTPLTRLTNGTLDSWIQFYDALPSWRMRWCTRHLKIEPCIAFLKRHAPATLYVGLRADEEERQGLYGEHAIYRYPLREWGWGLAEVRGYLRERGVIIPTRTDCDRCPYQRLGEWKALWREHPDRYAEAEAQEAQVGATFRSPGRDTWPASLVELRGQFERGRTLPEDQLEMFDGDDACRVCRL
jgi:3'-phosphoadenosine 5'-phosphosulfate sulfotransferase (PAPS reductase)/FAD synthetase